ncbi:hypothetical protein GGX14DRAFT_457505 [Mycena pura]|uniref:DUF5648 domain-containing protein n=1 Tax=Mycena pura TaxID=153505 RepID=A0AAD6V909_9AGAR|nr:hypothetical protein GGX14DRAFT_457505 [Mycena pura]
MRNILLAILLSVAANLASGSALNTVAGRSAETSGCGDPDDALQLYRLHRISYSWMTDVGTVNDLILDHGLLLETVAAMVFVTQEESTVPFYFLSSSALHDNFLTVNAIERDTAIAQGYLLRPEFQTFIYATQVCGSVPFYHVFNSAKTNNFYTISESERDSAISSGGYTDQGIAGYVLPPGVAC